MDKWSELNMLSVRKTTIYLNFLSQKGLKGIVVNGYESLENTTTVPYKEIFFQGLCIK